MCTGAAIRLIHQATNCALHSHAGYPSPSTGQQEVTCFGARDANDVWTVEIVDGQPFLNEGVQLRLIHQVTNHALHSHGIPMDGQQEVTCYEGRDQNDVWVVSL